MARPLDLGRRRFLRMAAAAGLVGPPLLTSALRGMAKEANERLTVGFIGVGTQGGGHVRAFLGYPDVQVIAVCDVAAPRREFWQKKVDEHYTQERAKGSYKGCQAYVDFRDLLARKDLDAVVIATPDHWHAIPSVEAAKAKKDVYCEKPLTLAIAQGRKVAEAVARNQIVFQTGSQQRSEFGGHFRKAVEYVRNGRIGKVKEIHVGVGSPAVRCDLPEQPTPEGTAWEMWLGPAPMRGFNEVLCPKGVHHHFPAWRNYREYGGGGLADMGAHHFDIAQWALDMDRSGPVRIEPPEDAKATSGLRYVYANGVVMYHGGNVDCRFVGTEGTIDVTRSGIASTPEAILTAPIGKDEFHVYAAHDHRKNWLECIRSRKEPIAPAEVGHRSATICHLGNIGYQLRRPLRWDPMREQFVDDVEANKLVDRTLREPWKL